MKKNLIRLSVILLASTLIFSACGKQGCTDEKATNYDEKAKKDDGTCIYPEVDGDTLEVKVEANISSNETWTTGKTYILTDRIAVLNGVTLTIEPGVIIKGEAGSGDNATCLIIAQGGKINAVGTASQPIIFTSVADEIEPGQIASPNLDTDLNGLWGGLIILGKAPISASGGTTAQVEGIPTSDSNGLYGGSSASDNSGTLKYVSIRHGGTNIGQDNEINGLTLGGVGSGTSISYIEIVATQDDGIEFFGGTVNLTNVIILNNGDDGLDTDQAFAGSVDNFMIINPGDKAFELDGPEGSYAGAGHTLKNGTVYMESCAGGYDDDSNTDAIVHDVFFTHITSATGMSNDYNVNGTFVASNLQFDVTPVDLDGDDQTADVAPVALDYFSDMNSTIISEVTTATVGADKTKFQTWTFADKAGKL